MMLSKLIVSSYQMLLEISMWLTLAACAVAGWYLGDGVLAALVGLIAGFVIIVVIFGAFLILGDIRQSVRAIEKVKANS